MKRFHCWHHLSYFMYWHMSSGHWITYYWQRQQKTVLSVCTWRYSFQSHLSILLYIVSNHINPAGNYRNRYIQSACSLYLLCRCSRQPISVYSLFRELVLHTCRLQNEFQNRKENQLLSSGNDSYVTGDICIDIIYKTTCNCRCIWGNCSFRNWNDFGKNSDLWGCGADELLKINKAYLWL